MANDFDIRAYVRNATRSSAYIGIEALKTLNPTIASLADTNKDIIKDALDNVRNYKKLLRSGKETIAQNEYLKIGQDTVHNFMDDLKTGKFYNKERERGNTDAMMAGFGFDDFNFDDTDSFDDEPKVSTSGVSKEDLNSVGKNISNAVGHASFASADYIVKSTRATSKIEMAHMDMLFGKLNMSVSGISSSIASVHKDLVVPATQHFSNASQYYKFATDQLAKQTGYLENINKLLTENFKSGKRAFKNKDNPFDIFNGGNLDLAAWGKHAKKNLSNELGMLTTALSMMESMDELAGGKGSGLRSMLHSPVALMINMALGGRLTNSRWGRSFDKLNKSIAGGLSSIPDFLRRKSKDKGGIWEFVNNIFGVNMSEKKKLDPSKYYKGKVDWTGKDSKALQEVIPTQLGLILATLSNTTPKVFDYDKGKWVTIKEVRADMMKSIKGTMTSSQYDINRLLNENFIKDAEDGNAKLGFNKQFKNVYSSKMFKTWQDDNIEFLHYLRQRNKNIPVTEAEWKSLYNEMNRAGLLQVSAATGSGLILKSNFNRIKAYYKKIYAGSTSRGDIMSARSALTASKADSNRLMERMEYEGTVHNLLYNDMNYDSFRGDKTKSNKPIINNDFNRFIDKKGNNIFFYLQSMTKSLLEISDNLKYGRGVVNNRRIRRGTGFSNTSYEIPTNTRVLQSVARERRTAAQSVRQDRKYDADDEGGGEALTEEEIVSHNKYRELARSFKDNISDNRFMKKTDNILRSIGELFGKPSEGFEKLVDRVDRNIFKFFWGDPDDKGKGSKHESFVQKMFAGISNVFKTLTDKAKNVFNNHISPLFGALADKVANIFGYNDFSGLKQGIKNSRFVTGVKEGFRNVGRFVKSSVTDTFGEVVSFAGNTKAGEAIRSGSREINPWAARGGVVTKSGMISVSEGEMIIPNNRPYSNKYAQQRREKRTALQYLRSGGTNYFGSFKDGGVAVTAESLRNKLNKLKEKASKIDMSKTGAGKKLEGITKSINRTIDRLLEIDPNADISSIDSDYISADKRGSDKEEVARRIRLLRRRKIKSDIVDPLAATASDATTSVVHRLFGDLSKDKSDTTSRMKSVFSEIKKHAPSIAVGGGVGAAAFALGGLVGGPILGAATGAAVAYAMKSESLQDKLFGEVDDKGNRHGGVFGPRLTKFLTKVVPDLSKYGITGGVAGLLGVVPGGPLAGVAIGATLGYVAKSENFKNYLFGEEGLFGKDFDKKLKKAFPKVAVGATGMALAGPFGLVGNLLLGGTLGYLSDTKKFKELIFGVEDENGVLQGGILGYARTTLIDPLRDYLKGGFKKAEDYIVKHLVDPLGKLFLPLTDRVKSVFDTVGDYLKNKIDEVVIQPIAATLNRWVFKPVAKLFGSLGKGAIGLAKFGIRAVGGSADLLGEGLKVGNIRRGIATSMSAQQRAANQTDVNIGTRHRFAAYDRAAANMDEDTLRSHYSNIKKYKGILEKGTVNNKEIKQDLMNKLLADTAGNSTWFDNQALVKLLSNNDFDGVEEWVRNQSRKPVGLFGSRTKDNMRGLGDSAIESIRAARDKYNQSLTDTANADLENYDAYMNSLQALGLNPDMIMGKKGRSVLRLIDSDISHLRKNGKMSDGEIAKVAEAAGSHKLRPIAGLGIAADIFKEGVEEGKKSRGVLTQIRDALFKKLGYKTNGEDLPEGYTPPLDAETGTPIDKIGDAVSNLFSGDDGDFEEEALVGSGSGARRRRRRYRQRKQARKIAMQSPGENIVQDTGSAIVDNLERIANNTSPETQNSVLDKVVKANSDEQDGIKEVATEHGVLRYIKTRTGNWIKDVRDKASKEADKYAQDDKKLRHTFFAGATTLLNKLLGGDKDKEEKKKDKKSGNIFTKLLGGLGNIVGYAGGAIKSIFDITGLSNIIGGGLGLAAASTVAVMGWDVLKEHFPGVADGIINIFSRVGDWFKEKAVPTIINGATRIVSGIGNVFVKRLPDMLKKGMDYLKGTKGRFDYIEDSILGKDSSLYGEDEYMSDHISDRYLKSMLKYGVVAGKGANFSKIPLVGKHMTTMWKGANQLHDFGSAVADTGVLGKLGRGAKKFGSGAINKTKSFFGNAKDMGFEFIDAVKKSKVKGPVSLPTLVEAGTDVSKLSKEAVEVATSNFGKEATETLFLKTPANIGLSVVDDATEAAVKKAGLMSKIVELIKVPFNKLFEMLGIKGASAVTQEAAETLAKEASKKSGSKLLKLAGGPLGLAFMVEKFTDGLQRARAKVILGILDDKIPFHYRLVAATLNSLNELLLGIIPTEWIFNVIFNALSMFNLPFLADLQKRREEAKGKLASYNAAHGETYNIEEYVHNVQKDFTVNERLKKTVGDIAKKGWEGTKKFVSGTIDYLKDSGITGAVMDFAADMKDNVIDPFMSTIGPALKDLGKDVPQLLKQIWDGDVIGIFSSEITVSEDNKGSLLNYVTMTGLKMVGAPLAAGKFILNKIGDVVGPFLKTNLGPIFKDAIDSVSHTIKCVVDGDIVKFATAPINMKNMSAEGQDGVGGAIGKGISLAIDLGLRYIAAPFVAGSWVIHKIQDIINFGKEGGFERMGGYVMGDAKHVYDSFVGGDIVGLWATGSQSQSEGGIVKYLVGGLHVVEKLFYTGPTAVNWAFNKIYDSIMHVVNVAKDLGSDILVDHNALTSKMRAGDLVGFIGYQSASTGKEGVGGVLPQITTFVEQIVLMAPTAVFTVVHKVKDFLGNRASRIVDNAKMTSELWEYLKKDSMAGWDATVDSYRPKGDTFLDKMDNLSITIGSTIIRGIVGFLRPIVSTILKGKKYIDDFFGDAVANDTVYVYNDKTKRYDDPRDLGTVRKSGIKYSTEYGAEEANGTGSGAHTRQDDPIIGKRKFGKKTVAENGCGPASANSVLRRYGVKSTLDDAVNYAEANGYIAGASGTKASYFRDMFRSHGISSRYSDNLKDIKSNIKAGRPTVLLGQNSGNTAKEVSPFGPKPHYVVAQGMDKRGNVIVDDPELGGTAIYNNSILNSTRLGVLTGGDSGIIKVRDLWKHGGGTGSSVGHIPGVTASITTTDEYKLRNGKPINFDNVSFAIFGKTITRSLYARPFNGDQSKLDTYNNGINSMVSNLIAIRKKNISNAQQLKEMKTMVDNYTILMENRFPGSVEPNRLAEARGNKNASGKVSGSTTSSSSTTSGTTDAGVGTVTTPIGDMDYLGKYVKKFESGDKGSAMISTGKGDRGGASFGSYQFPSNKNASDSLWVFWDKYYKSKYPVEPGNTQAFKDAWVKAVNDNPDEFFKNEHTFCVDRYYIPTVNHLKSLGIGDPVTLNSRGVQEMLWSNAVQLGPISGANKVKSAGVTSSTNANDYISKVLDYKIANIGSIYKSSSQAVRNYIAGSRWPEEKQLCLGLANQPAITDPYAIQGSVGGVGGTSAQEGTSGQHGGDSFDLGGIVSNIFRGALGKVFGKMGGVGETLSKIFLGGVGSNTGASGFGMTASYGGERVNNLPLTEKEKKIVDTMKSIEMKNNYVFGGNSPFATIDKGAKMGSADCSNTVSGVIKRAIGVDIGSPTSTIYTQYQQRGGVVVNDNRKLDESKLRPGDVLLYSRPNKSYTAGRPDRVGHVEMYIGDGMRMGHGSGVGPVKSSVHSDEARFLKAIRYTGYQPNTFGGNDGNKIVSATEAKADAMTATGSGIRMLDFSRYYGGNSAIDKSASIATKEMIKSLDHKARRLIGGESGAGINTPEFIQLLQVQSEQLKQIVANTIHNQNITKIIALMMEMMKLMGKSAEITATVAANSGYAASDNEDYQFELRAQTDEILSKLNALASSI